MRHLLLCYRLAHAAQQSLVLYHDRLTAQGDRFKPLHRRVALLSEFGHPTRVVVYGALTDLLVLHHGLVCDWLTPVFAEPRLGLLVIPYRLFELYLAVLKYLDLQPVKMTADSFQY